MSAAETVHCRNPDPAKAGVNIPAWKFELVRRIILDELSMNPAGVRFTDLAERVRSRLTPDQARALGSVAWHTTVVKLHLEAVSEIQRVEGARPQLLRSA